jgi:hypothetical protein
MSQRRISPQPWTIRGSTLNSSGTAGTPNSYYSCCHRCWLPLQLAGSAPGKARMSPTTGATFPSGPSLPQLRCMIDTLEASATRRGHDDHRFTGPKAGNGLPAYR